MTIYSPADAPETVQCMKVLAQTKSPSYLRIGKPTYSLTKGEKLTGAGDWVLLSGDPSSKIAVVSTGTALGHAVSFQLESLGGSGAIFTVPIWSMSAKIEQFKYLSNYSEVHTFEDHILDGGFGSWMLEATSKMKSNPPRIIVHAIDAVSAVGIVGGASYLERIGGLDGKKNREK
jgi:transketolase